MNTIERKVHDSFNKSIEKLVDEKTKEIKERLDHIEFNDKERKDEINALIEELIKTTKSLEEKTMLR